MIKRIFMTVCLMASMSFFAQAQNEVITTETIVNLLQEGFGSDEIIGLIETSPNREITFSIADMRKLKQAGADSGLITYIQKIAKVDQGYEGVLWWNPSDGGKPRKLHRTTFEHESAGGSGAVLGILGKATGIIGNNALGNAATIGLLSSSGGIKKVAMQGAHAKVVLEGANASNPIFRFYFPKTDSNSFEKTADSWYYSMMNEIESPNEFQCIRMKEKKTKRTFPEGISYSTMGFTAKNATRDIVDFEIKDISNNVFEVSFPNGLEPGEYCFFYKNGANNRWFAEHMFGFDFSVQ